MISLDTETCGLDVFHGNRPYFVTICREDGTQTWWEWDVNPRTREVTIPKADVIELRQLICDSGEELVLQNVRFDAAQLREAGVIPEWPWDRTHDTLIASHLLASNTPRDLTELAFQYLGRDIKRYEDALEKATQECRRFCRTKLFKQYYGEWAIADAERPDMPSATKASWKADGWLPRAVADAMGYPDDHPYRTVLRDYANADSAATLFVFLKQRKLLQQRKLERHYEEGRKLMPILSGMEAHGMTMSGRRFDEQRVEYAEKSECFEEECLALAAGYGYDLVIPKTVNKSLTTFMFDVLKVPPRKRSKKTGAASLDVSVMEEYAATLTDPDAVAFVKALLAKRGLDKAVSTLENYRRFRLPVDVDDPDGDSWYVTHTSINQTGTDTTRLSTERPANQNVCFDGETELLTTDGWVRADALTADHEVAQFWTRDGSITFTVPDELHSPHYTGEMCHITTHRIDMLLTPAHRCLVRNRKTLRWEDVRADDFRNDVHHIHAGVYGGGGTRFSKDEVTWLCAVQADGHFVTAGGEQYGVSLSFKKSRKIERLRQALTSLQVPHHEKVDGRGVATFYLGKHNRLAVLAKDLMPDKCFGPWLLQCDRTTLDLIKDEIFFWDGDSTRRQSYTSSVKKNTDWIQVLFTLSGDRSWIKSFMPRNGWAKNVHHCLNVSKGINYTGTTGFQTRAVPWDGKVYCVTVPSGYIVTRRNGRVSVTGNSKKKAFNLRRPYGPPPGREWWFMDYENLELRIPAYASGEQDLIALFERYDEPPYYGSEHILNFSVVYEDLWEQVLEEYGPEGAAEYIKSKEGYGPTWYRACKAGDFALQYNCGRETADRTFGKRGSYDKLKSRFAKKEALNQKCIREAKRTGYVETMPRKNVDPLRGYPLMAGRTMWNSVLPTTPLSYFVQGTAGECARSAMIRCDPVLREWTREDPRGYFMMIQVHDELGFDFPAEDYPGEHREKVLELKRLMELSGDDINVPLKVSVSYHPNNWAEEEEYEVSTTLHA